MEEKKKFWQSRTVWTNLVMAVAVLIQALAGQEWLDAEAQGAIIILANLVLRIITSQGLEK